MTSGYSQQDPEDAASDYAAKQFQIDQTLARTRTMMVVKVVAVSAGGLTQPSTVNVQPLVKLMDGQGNVSSHGTINNIPVLRLGGGDNLIICDPAVDDIGWIGIADRDISVVKNTQAEAAPGSRRKFDFADAVYIASMFKANPTQYIEFTDTGIVISDKNGNSIHTSATGTVIADNNANSINMAAGFVNIITPVLQVNGVPVTVP